MVGISDGLGEGAGDSVGESVVSWTSRSVSIWTVLMDATGTSGMEGTLSDKMLGRSQALDTPKSTVSITAR